jgi:endonuclease/exonuclease/phosphatase family metal-dependent hydrolase
MALTIATFNLKNLLEPSTDAQRAVLPEKLETLARMLAACDADVVGLQEVGSAAVLEQVLERMPSRGGYGEPVMGTADSRGIACALVSRLPLAWAHVHTAAALGFPVFQDGDPLPFGERIPLRRGVVHVRVPASGLGEVHVLVAHFKSARPVRARDAAGEYRRSTTALGRAESSVRSQVWRAAEGLFVRSRVDDVLATQPDALVAVVGDLNDVLESSAVGAVRSRGPGELFDASSAIEPARKYTTMHGGRRQQIDHVLVTEALHARVAGARILNEALREHEPLPESGDEIPTADSDHAPLVVRFE